MTVRKINPWEMGDLIALAQHFHAASEIGAEFAPDIFANTMGGMAQEGRLGAFGMFDGDKMVGCLLGCVLGHFLARAALAQELMWWVEPEHRRNSGAIRLVDLFEKWAKERGAFGIVMASFELTDGDNRLEAIYRKRGYKLLERHYFKYT